MPPTKPLTTEDSSSLSFPTNSENAKNGIDETGMASPSTATEPASSDLLVDTSETMATHDEEHRVTSTVDAGSHHDVGKLDAAEAASGPPSDSHHVQDQHYNLIDLHEDEHPKAADRHGTEAEAQAQAQSGNSDETHKGKQTSYDPFDEPEGVDLGASIATLKPPLPALSPAASPASSSKTATSLHFLSAEAANTADTTTYIDPTPATPMTSSRPPSRSPSAAGTASESHSRPRRSMESSYSPTRSDAAYDDKRYMSEDEQESGSRSAEIQTIMEQFSGDGGGPGAEEVMSPRLEIASPMLAAPHQHPPRKSSLEPLAPSIAQQIQDLEGLSLAPSATSSAISASASPSAVSQTEAKLKEPEDQGPPVPPKDGVAGSSLPSPQSLTEGSADNHMSPLSPTVSLHRPPPPEPEPEPTLPFDFHRFLEQLRNKKADPVARYLKSFLSEFGKRQWMVHEQVKIISDFLAFIANKMAVCEVWRDLSDAEFDNAREGMEKLVMNRLYSQTFSPAIPPPQPIPGARPKRRGGERPMGPGRRGQHQEDVERDEILSQKINIYSWIREPHLDIPPVGESGKRFLKLAQQELLKIRSYRAPRDKIICVLNCCKVIFGLLKHNKSDSSADSFMPLLIYVVLQSNPDHLVSNVQYILRFRNQEKLGGEAGYYLSSLMGVIQFIENMDRTTLTISDEEFEKNVEAAVSAIAEKHRAEDAPLPIPPLSEKEDEKGSGSAALLQAPGAASAGPSSPSRATSSHGRISTDSDRARPRTPRRPVSSDGQDDDDEEEEKDAITGLLRTIQRPLTSIASMFSDEPAAAAPPPAPAAGDGGASGGNARPPSSSAPDSASRHNLSAEEAAARQASAEAAEAQRLHRVEHASIVETLASMFPDLDREIISDVVYQKEGRVGLAVDACLALSS